EAVTAATINPQTQTRITWTDSPDVAESYLDQLSRSGSIDSALAAQVGVQIGQWRRNGADPSGSAALSLTLTEASGTATGVAATRLKALAEVFGRLGG
ncbi:MAG: hypothetical protein Q8J71_06495, partial [Brevundimonas sp.]|nr:hypothetical protein [Brevundimonas sp.]